MEDHDVVAHEDWLEARRALLADEKEFARLRERLADVDAGTPMTLRV